MPDVIGMQLGQYRVMAPLGRGGMAAVYRAHQPGVDRYVALKLVALEQSTSPEFIERFRREARVIASLEHPNILPVYDYGEAAGYLYLVMRLVGGGTLGDALTGRPLPREHLHRVLAQVGDALDYAHSRGVVHRDVKPSNILVDERGQCLLTDFGIAKMAQAATQFTVTGSFLGTPHYASPEQGLGQPLDGRSDLYSLGVILYEMATGRPPFQADTPMGVLVKHVHEPLPAPRSLNPALSPALERLLVKALAKGPDQRYPTAALMLADLDQALTGASPATTAASGAAHPVVESFPAATVLEPAAAPRTARPAAPAVPPPPPAPRRFPLGLALGGGLLVFVSLCALIALAAAFLPGLLNQAQLPGTGTLPATPAPALDAATQATSPRPVLPSPTPANVLVVPPIGSDNIYVEYILDASGSMLEPLQGKSRLAIAQDVLSERVQALPPDVHVGLRVYGHRVSFQQRDDSCADIELIVPIRQGGAAAIVAWLPTMQAQGMTPMSESLRLAAEDFSFEPGRHNSIILISDGIETCGDDPSDVARFLQELGIDFTIHVVGLGVDAQTRAQLSRLADTGRGVYHDVDSEQDLKDALADVEQRVIDEGLALAAASPSPEPTSAPSPVPQANFDAAPEGAVHASTTYPGYAAADSVDGDVTTSWFSAGTRADGQDSTFTWQGQRDDLIASITLLSNADHATPEFRTGFGFGFVTVQVLDSAGVVVFEESVSLPGTPDPHVTVNPGVVGRAVHLIFTGHEAPDCGGFAELQVGVVR
jgi:serine/threonine-protein kinase